MEPTKEQLNQLKAIELEMLKQFISVCQQLNLKYYLIGGTLLGAVRHKGFIPWDDDIDVAMPRADYEIFISKAQELLPSKYFVQTNKTDPELPMNFCKLRNSETTFIETSVKNCRINHGVFIDVFPLDWYPEKKLKAKIFDIKNKYLKMAIGKVFTVKLTKKQKLKRVIRKILTCFTSPKKAVKNREKLLKSVGVSYRSGNLCGAWGKKEIVPNWWFGEGKMLIFEDIVARVPQEYEKWLTQVYGDYMQLPPEEKREGHHYTEVLDLEKSYIEYRNS